MADSHPIEYLLQVINSGAFGALASRRKCIFSSSVNRWDVAATARFAATVVATAAASYWFHSVRLLF